MKQLLLFSSFFIGISIGFGQESKIDSLKQNLSINIDDGEKLKIYKDLFLVVFNSDNFHELDSTLIQNMNTLSKKINDKELEIKSYMLFVSHFMRNENFEIAENYSNLLELNIHRFEDLSLYYQVQNLRGRMYHHFMNYDAAIDIYQKAISKFKKMPKGEIIFDLYSNIASSYRNNNQLNEETDALINAIEFSDSNSNKENQAYSRYNLAWAYLNRANYSKAIDYFKSGIDIIEKEKIIKYRYFHNGLGLAYSRSGQFDLALNHYLTALSFFKDTKNVRFEFDTLNNISALYTRMNKPSKGEKYARLALEIANNLKHPIAISAAKQNLAASLKDLGKYNEAEQLFLELLKDTLSFKNNDIHFKNSLFLNLSDIYYNTNNYKDSYIFLKKNLALSDSINKQNLDSKFSDIETKYQTEKKEKENLQLKADNTEQALLTQKANTRNWILGLGILLLSVSAFFIWRRYKAEAKAKQIISEQKDEIEQQKNMVETLQKELHHRMKNNLSFIDLFINLAKGRFEDKAYQNKLNELQNRMRSMFEVHKQLFKKDDVTSVKAKNYIDTLVENVKQAYEKDSVTITNTTNENETLLANTSFPVGLIVNEFVTNSYKYAFEDQKEGTIHITLTSQDNVYKLTLKDNGKGLPKDFDIDELDSFGLETIQLLTKEYGGTFTIDGSNGVAMNITLPKTAA